MASAAIFQRFARLRWIGFGLLMRDRKFSRRFSVPQTPQFKFTEAVSFVINCDTQEEIDYYWEKLTADGGKEVECGWSADKYRTLLADNNGKLFRRIGEGCRRAATGVARGLANEEAPSRKPRKSIYRKVTCGQ